MLHFIENVLAWNVFVIVDVVIEQNKNATTHQCLSFFFLQKLQLIPQQAKYGNMECKSILIEFYVESICLSVSYIFDGFVQCILQHYARLMFSKDSDKP